MFFFFYCIKKYFSARRLRVCFRLPSRALSDDREITIMHFPKRVRDATEARRIRTTRLAGSTLPLSTARPPTLSVIRPAARKGQAAVYFNNPGDILRYSYLQSIMEYETHTVEKKKASISKRGSFFFARFYAQYATNLNTRLRSSSYSSSFSFIFLSEQYRVFFSRLSSTSTFRVYGKIAETQTSSPPLLSVTARTNVASSIFYPSSRENLWEPNKKKSISSIRRDAVNNYVKIPSLQKDTVTHFSVFVDLFFIIR